MIVRVKVCCISSLAEAELAIEHGASYLGLVSEMPSGPGVIAEALIAEIARAVPRHIRTVLLTKRTSAREIAEQARAMGVRAVQLVDAVDREAHRELRTLLPGIELIQVVHVEGEPSLDEALDYASRDLDALLLDSGVPSRGELGGTGRVHDWSISARIIERSPVPVFLAGGLRPQNVREAVDRMKPFGVDICSGLRTHGALDPLKIRAFAAALN
jgi:phosphoribosylanthranilate isomerase